MNFSNQNCDQYFPSYVLKALSSTPVLRSLPVCPKYVPLQTLEFNL